MSAHLKLMVGAVLISGSLTAGIATAAPQTEAKTATPAASESRAAASDTSYLAKAALVAEARAKQHRQAMADRAARKAKREAKKARALEAARSAADKERRQTSTRPTRSETRSKAPSNKGVVKKYWGPAQQWALEPKTRAVIMCESSDNPKDVSKTGKYRGLYQFDAGKWASYGGLDFAPTADRASRAVQNYVAYRIYVGNGWKPWTCA